MLKDMESALNAFLEHLRAYNVEKREIYLNNLDWCIQDFKTRFKNIANYVEDSNINFESNSDLDSKWFEPDVIMQSDFKNRGIKWKKKWSELELSEKRFVLESVHNQLKEKMKREVYNQSGRCFDLLWELDRAFIFYNWIG